MAFCGFFKPTIIESFAAQIKRVSEEGKEFERGVEVGAKETVRILEEEGIIRTVAPGEQLPESDIGVEPVPVQSSVAVARPMYGVSTPGSTASQIAFPETVPRVGNGATTPIPGVTTAGYTFPELHPLWYGVFGFGLIWLMSKGRR